MVTLSATVGFPTALTYWESAGGPQGRLQVTNIMSAVGCSTPTGCPWALEDQWSADQRVTAANCPARWLVFNSANDEQPVQQADALSAVLTAQGCVNTETIVPGTAHA